ncbi:MAG: glucose PTS transporter subunit IIA [Coriobacteriia bacterium]|nr:glucose PTS transporter subunit IIA [Coriobacteriia bacterium]
MADAKSAEAILAEVGGAENVELLTNCATRLRFTLFDASKANKAKIEKIPGVLAAIEQGEKSFQVVIGPAVEDMRKEIEKLPGMGDGNKKTAPVRDDRTIEDIKAEHRSKVRGKKWVDSFFEYLSDSFRPIIGVLLAASLVIAGINICIALHIIESDTANSTVLFFKCISQSVFNFIGVFVAYNACKKLKVDPWLGVTVMLVFLGNQYLALGAPADFTEIFNSPEEAQNVLNAQSTTGFLASLGLDKVTYVMGIPMIQCQYSGNVFVPLLMCPILAILYRFVKKVIPSNLHLIFVPGICIVVMAILTGFLIGPIGTLAGALLGQGFTWLNTHVPLLLVFIIPMIYPFLVPLGLHWPLNALMISNISTLGYDFIQGPMGIYDFACYGASFGVLLIAIRENNKEMKSIAGGAVAAGLLGGISEPSLYGIHLRYKRAYPIMIIGCVVGALTIGFLGLMFPSSNGVAGVTTTAFAFTSLLTIPVFDQMWVYAVSIAVAFIVPAIIIFVFDYRTKEQKEEMRLANAAEQAGLFDFMEYMTLSTEQIKEKANSTKFTEYDEEYLNSPIAGTTKNLESVNDKVFSKKIFGEGIAIIPDNPSGKKQIVSPVSGRVTAIAKDKHAYTITTFNGAAILVHIGLDTVNLHSEGFECAVRKDELVLPGDPIVKVDFDKISEANLGNEIIVTVCNSKQLKAVNITEGKKDVTLRDTVINIEY